MNSPATLMAAQEPISTLTEDILLAKSGKSSPEDVTKINAFALGVQNIPSLQAFTRLQVVSLSLNRISTLKAFEDCHELRELHLRKNLIEDLSEIKYLAGLPHLHTLLLSDNPCTKTKDYRKQVICMLKHLKKLDSLPVSEDERESACNESLAGTSSGENFSTCADEVKIYPSSIDKRSPSPTAPNTTAPAIQSDCQDKQWKSYSNVLLATKLLLTEMSEAEIVQLKEWCTQEIDMRNK